MKYVSYDLWMGAEKAAYVLVPASVAPEVVEAHPFRLSDLADPPVWGGVAPEDCEDMLPMHSPWGLIAFDWDYEFAIDETLDGNALLMATRES